jgi:hypothetical protein
MILQSCISQDHPTGTIEQIRGAWRVAVSTACCDSSPFFNKLNVNAGQRH